MKYLDSKRGSDGDGEDRGLVLVKHAFSRQFHDLSFEIRRGILIYSKIYLHLYKKMILSSLLEFLLVFCQEEKLSSSRHIEFQTGSLCLESWDRLLNLEVTESLQFCEDQLSQT